MFYCCCLKGVSLEDIDELFSQGWINRIKCGFSCRYDNKIWIGTLKMKFCHFNYTNFSESLF